MKRIAHSGGAIACFFLMDRAGTVECSRSFYSYSAYRPDPKDSTAMPKNNFTGK